jgi:hypothetical protein
MVRIYEIGKYYGKSRRESARQALRGEASLFWGRDERLAFLAGYGRGRHERLALYLAIRSA